MPLTELELKAIAEMEELGILQNVEAPKLLVEHKCVIAVFCGDGNYAHGILNHHARLWRACHEDEPLTHLHTWNGGGLRLLSGFPLNLNIAGTDEVFLDELRETVGIKQSRIFALYAHAPCAAARLCAWNLYQVIDGLLAAKARIKEAIDGARVAPFFLADKGTNVHEPHFRFVHPNLWLRWRQQLASRYWPDTQ